MSEIKTTEQYEKVKKEFETLFDVPDDQLTDDQRIQRDLMGEQLFDYEKEYLGDPE